MSIQIFILSQLMEESSYPYKLKKKMADFQLLDLNNSLTESKLYYHFEALKKSGLVEVQEVLHEENRPDKQVFRITEKGLEEFPKKIYKLFQTAESIGEMTVGIANLKYVDREKVLDILKKRLVKIQKNWKILNSVDTEKYKTPDKEMLIDFIRDYAENRHQQTLIYFQRLIDHIEKGEL